MVGNPETMRMVDVISPITLIDPDLSVRLSVQSIGCYHIEGKNMANLDNVLQQLRQEHNQAQSQVDKLKEAISVIEGLSGRMRAAANGTRPRRTMSAAARRRIARAQKARWAKLWEEPRPISEAKSMRTTPAKRRLSPEGRKRIIAATKARWAR